MKNYVIVIDREYDGLFILEAWGKWFDNNDGTLHRWSQESYLTHKAAINEYERLLKASEGGEIRPVLIDRASFQLPALAR